MSGADLFREATPAVLAEAASRGLAASLSADRWPCADWCCSRGCPGIGNALCASPGDTCPEICTCGHAEIRAMADELASLRRLSDLAASQLTYMAEAEKRGAVKALEYLMRQHADSMAIVQLDLTGLRSHIESGEMPL